LLIAFNGFRDLCSRN